MTGKTVTLLLAITLLWCCSSSGQTPRAADSLDRLRAEHQRVLDELNGKSTGARALQFDDSRVSELLKTGWSLAGAWAASFLERHAEPSARDLEKIFRGFSPPPAEFKGQLDFLGDREYSFDGSAVRIEPAIYVVQARYIMGKSTGTFMIVARNRDGRFQVLWNVKDLAAAHYARKDEIGRWAHLVRRAYYNGPMDVREILPLPSTANSHARFLVDAYQSADGGTTMAQLSVWEWDGSEAIPLFIRPYEYAADYDRFRFNGNTLKISTKEPLRAFFSCGMCPEPRGLWTVRITRDGVQDLGHRFLQPELQWADELLSKIKTREDTTSLADEKVVAALKAEEEGARESPDKFYWGMLSHYRVLRRGQQGAFELTFDDRQLRFAYILRNSRPYFTGVDIQ